MSETILTRERILEAAEGVLRRFGPSKATVVDVARALGVSHAAVYKHFASKAELRDAVTRVWLARASPPLEAIASEDSPAPDRLRRWLIALIAGKRERAFSDPELFATYHTLALQARDVVQEHVYHLTERVAGIVRDGIASGQFAPSADPSATARAIMNATIRFYNPAHASEWRDPSIDASFEDVWSLILNGLQTRSGE